MKNGKGVIAYLLIAFGMAWACWEIVIRLGISMSNPLFQIAAIPGAFAPAIAAFLVRKWITRDGFPSVRGCSVRELIHAPERQIGITHVFRQPPKRLRKIQRRTLEVQRPPLAG